jgi:hypothetical protein
LEFCVSRVAEEGKAERREKITQRRRVRGGSEREKERKKEKI